MPLASALENCDYKIEPSEIPCTVVSSFAYAAPCSDHIAETHNSSGDNFINFTFGDYGDSGLCAFTFNLTALGSYTFTVANGDIGEVLVVNTNMLIAMVIGIVAIVAIFLFLAFKLEETHNMIKLLLIFFSVILIGLIPVIFIIDDVSVIFHKLIQGFTWIFWLYVAGYLVYWLFVKIGLIIPNERKP